MRLYDAKLNLIHQFLLILKNNKLLIILKYNGDNFVFISFDK